MRRELFWFRLQLRRVDAGKVRRKFYEQLFALITEKTLPWVWAYAILPVALPLLAFLSKALTAVLWDHVGWVTAFALALDAGVFSRQVWAAKSQIEEKPARATLGDFVEAPDYSANLGFVHQVADDLRRVFAIIPQQYRPMVIFIDDLDRCSPTKVANVIEALNLFLAGEFPDCMFVLGIDYEMVAAALDQAHAEVIAKLPSYAKSASIGWRFMDKFVQLPFVVPSPGPSELAEYVASLFSRDKAPAKLDMAARERAARAVEKTGGNATPPTNILAEVVSERPLAAPQQEKLRKEIEVLQEMDRNIRAFSDAEGEIRNYLVQNASHFSNNPRDVKRFVNVFRFYFFLRAARAARGEPVPTLGQLSRWITLSLRWPEVVRWLRSGETSRDKTVSGRLEVLESFTGPAHSWSGQAATTLKLTAEEAPWINDSGLVDFLLKEAARQKEERISASCGKGLW